MVKFQMLEDSRRKWSGRWALIGRSITDIHVGDRFTIAIPYTAKYEKSNEKIDWSFKKSFPIELMVTRVLYYGKKMDCLYHGCSGTIVVKGDASKLIPDAFLQDQ